MLKFCKISILDNFSYANKNSDDVKSKNVCGTVNSFPPQKQQAAAIKRNRGVQLSRV